MTKELIEHLNAIAGSQVADYFTTGYEHSDAIAKAADAIERLELEITAATLRIENDALEIAELRAELKKCREYGEQVLQSSVMWHDHATKRTAQIAELRAELAALKQQPHIARATGKNHGDYSEVARVYETPLPDGVALYLAPGAQPVPTV